MADIDNITEKLASSTVEEKSKGKEVSFVGLGLTLSTEEDAADIVKAINDCPGMTTLRLEGNTVGIPAAKVIAKALESQPDFKIALWKDMFTGRDKTEIPQALSHLSNGIMVSQAKLVVLDLSDNAFGPRGLVGIQKLLESPACYTLEELHLNNNGLGITGAQLLSEALCNCYTNSCKNGTPMRLRIFVCGRNRLENKGAISMSKFLKQLGTLQSVAVPQNGIYHEGVKGLSDAFSANKNLKVINLEDNSLTKEGVVCITKALPHLKELQMLNLGDCLVRTDGAVCLATALESTCPDLRELNLGFNEIGIEGGEALACAMRNKEKLQTIILNGNNFGDEGCESIKKRFQIWNKADALGSLSEDEGKKDNEDCNPLPSDPLVGKADINSPDVKAEAKNNVSLANAAVEPITIPSFWGEHPELWFIKIESLFSISGITDDRLKFCYVVSVLSRKALEMARDIIVKPPAVKQYETIKQRIIDDFSYFEESRIEKELSVLSLEDDKPSFLLLKMIQLSAGKLKQEVLKKLWLLKLPYNVQDILSISSEDLEKLSLLADKIYEVINKEKEQYELRLLKLQTVVDELRNEVDELSNTRVNKHSRSSSRNRNNRRSISPTTKICWYHQKFGKLAQMCQSPCNFDNLEMYASL